MHRSRAGGSSPLATVEDIQRRLLRPPSLHSTPPTSTISSTYTLSLSLSHEQFYWFFLEFNFFLFNSTMYGMAFQAAIPHNLKWVSRNPRNWRRRRRSSRITWILFFSPRPLQRSAARRRFIRRRSRRKWPRISSGPSMNWRCSWQIRRARTGVIGGATKLWISKTIWIWLATLEKVKSLALRFGVSREPRYVVSRDSVKRNVGLHQKRLDLYISVKTFSFLPFS